MPSRVERTIGEVMVGSPHTIGVEQSVAVARRKMNKHHIRHLPVLHGGRLVGMVTDRDLTLVESLHHGDLEAVAVDEVMSPEPYAITPSTSLEWVALDMAEHKYGSAVVLDHGEVVGVFTTVDALRALSDLLGHQRRR